VFKNWIYFIGLYSELLLLLCFKYTYIFDDDFKYIVN